MKYIASSIKNLRDIISSPSALFSTFRSSNLVNCPSRELSTLEYHLRGKPVFCMYVRITPYLDFVASQFLDSTVGYNDHNIFNPNKLIGNCYLPYLGSKGKPRAARRARKPLRDNWPKTPIGKWLRCTYRKCGFEWQYFGGHNWAQCPACHSTMKVAAARRNYKLADKD